MNARSQPGRQSSNATFLPGQRARRLLAAGLVAWVTLVEPTVAFADSERTPPDQGQTPATEAVVPKLRSIQAGIKRERPNYDGRPERSADPAEVLLWVPRVALFPLYVVSEYVVRRPLGWFATWVERHDVPTLLVNFFTFGPERKQGFIPTGFIDFGFRPSVGLYFFAYDLGRDGNDFSARVGWGGEGWRALRVKDALAWGDSHDISLTADYLERPDWLFAGFGPETRRQDIGRYARRDLKLTLDHRSDLWRSSELESALTLHQASYDIDKTCCADPNVQSQVARGVFAEPTAHRDGYLVLSAAVQAALDTRRPRNLKDPAPGSDFASPSGEGIQLQLRAAHHTGLKDDPARTELMSKRYHWVSYGATVGGFVDLTGEQRVLGLSLISDFTDPVQADGVIPFDQQVSLGGPRPMRGFLEGRLRDRSASVALLEYSWPVWVWLDGSLHYAVGNVFGEHLSGWDVSRLRSSFGIGIQSNRAQDTPFQLLLALGTRSFENSSTIDSVRIAVGSTHGY